MQRMKPLSECFSTYLNLKKSCPNLSAEKWWNVRSSFLPNVMPLVGIRFQQALIQNDTMELSENSLSV
jgi:hypothetical protein